ncbi:alpha/beta-hydrolase [Xylariomycetidae sp. FL0641]|nr:alpha/beta-hydrolase [Xylariomycetidae sp. FL0641]
MSFASHHTIEDLQAFTSQWVPHPTWIKVEEVEIPETHLDEAADALRKQLGPDGIRKVGGVKWWQWRKPETKLTAEWIEMRADYNERQKTGGECKRVMLYVHGGAYFFGSVDEHRYQMQRHARKLRARVFAPEYRLAPQFPFPCGLQDCLAAYQYLLTMQDPTTIILAGDSAGGGMVVSMLVTMRDQGIPLPAGAILISPWVDLTHSFPSVSLDCPLDYIPQCGFHHKPSQAWPPLNADEMADMEKKLDLERKITGEDEPGKGEGESMKPTSAEMARKSQETGQQAPAEQDDIPPVDSHAETRYLSINIDGKEVELKNQMQMYTTNEMLTHPLVSPVLQPTLGGLPPLLITTGGGEILRDEQIYLAHKCANPSQYPPADIFLTDAGREQIARYKPTDVQLQVWDDLCHVAPTLSFTRPAKHMYRSIAQFGAWALARAQKTEIEILDDSSVSHISRSSSDSSAEGTATVTDADPSNQPLVGRAGDPLPPFKNHMIRQRIDRHGAIRDLEPAAELPSCIMDPREIGVIKEGPVRKWLEARRQWDSRYGGVKAKVHKKRLKEMIEGYVGFDGETPPPSSLASRRKAKDTLKGRKRSKSMGLSLWALWGSKHDKSTMNREQAADGVPAVKATTTDEGEGTRSPDDMASQDNAGFKKDRLASPSRARTKTVRDEQQTADDAVVDETTPASTLPASREEQQPADEPLASPRSSSGLLTPSDLPLRAKDQGKRPVVAGSAVPFSLKREAETASMLTLTSTMDPRRSMDPPSRVASPGPAATDFPGGPDTVKPAYPVAGPSGSVPGTPGTPATPGIVVDGVPTPEARPGLETFVTAAEDLPRLSSER